eukprot:5725438-Pleurochrysis_carterae.AAC.2
MRMRIIADWTLWLTGDSCLQKLLLCVYPDGSGQERRLHGHAGSGGMGGSAAARVTCIRKLCGAANKVPMFIATRRYEHPSQWDIPDQSGKADIYRLE